MEKFLALSKEKQHRIIEAGFQCFGKMGYKKASAQDIAELAGISKGMIFHYFGSKKGMYLYLIQHAKEEVMRVFKDVPDKASADFFDYILTLTACKINCFRKHPAMQSFCLSFYNETAQEVFAETQVIREQGEEFSFNTLLTDTDTSKFKDPSYAALAWKLLMSFGAQYVNTVSAPDAQTLDALQKEFTQCVNMLKNNLYKPGFL